MTYDGGAGGTTGGYFVPRVSIIIPYQRDDARLESTLLSVLENRPEDCEIIVAHDGSYGNPYNLEDELIFVDTDSPASDVDLINAGLYAACAPVIHTLWPGILVRADWLEEPLERLDRTDAAAVAIPIVGNDGTALPGAQLSGARGALPWKRITQPQTGALVGPTIACGVYRRRILLALDGFLAGSALAASLEAAWAIHELNLPVAVSQTPVSCETSTGDLAPGQSLAAVGRLAAAYGKCPSGWSAAARTLICGLLTGQLGAAVAWTCGVTTAGRIDAVIAERLARAAGALAEDRPSTLSFPAQQGVQPRTRRAA
ncbi:MAG: hypothetical protein D6753_09715 [Planctomycetota bacterium]|nr:MAG: hypothetical protein D6753_09715 [Planctomycetota bacterium]